MLCSSLAQRPGTQQEMKPVICQSGRPGVGLGVVIERTGAADPRAEQMLFLGTLFEIHTPPRTPDQCDSFLTETPIKMSRWIFARLLCFTAFPPPCLFSLAVAHRCSLPLPTGRGVSTGGGLTKSLKNSVESLHQRAGFWCFCRSRLD